MLDSRPPTRRTSPDRGGDPVSPEATREMEELRRILMGEGVEQVDRLERRVDRVAAMEEDGQIPALSRSLPEAIALHGEDTQMLARALGPTIEKTVHYSIRRNPKPFVDALFPIIGPAIRRSIAEALRSMVETINRTLEHSLSIRSLQWRLEAVRTGRPFSEVVLSHTMAYKVEHLFLIERSSGLPMQHVAAESAPELDTDVISGMMSAVQDFVRESFGASREQNLNRVEIGDLTLLIEPGPRAVLAAVVRGVPTRELRERLQDVIEVLHLQYGHSFEGYSGDMAAFAHLRPVMEAGLHLETRPVTASSRWLWITLALFFVGSAIWLALGMRNQLEFMRYVEQLKDQPGLVVTEAGRADGAWFVEGLRDGFAPFALATHVRGDSIQYRWKPYVALEPAVLVRRLTAQWAAPASVVLSMRGDTVVARGTAPEEWITRVRERATETMGVRYFEDAELFPDSGGARAAIVAAQIRFVAGSSRLSAAAQAQLERLAGSMHAWVASPGPAGRPRTVAIVGHASPDGSPETNQRLRQERADVVRDALVQSGISPEALVLAFEDTTVPAPVVTFRPLE